MDGTGTFPQCCFLIFLAPSVKNTSLFCSSPLKTRNASIAFIAFFMPHAVRGICVLSILDMNHCVFHILCILFRSLAARVLLMFYPTSSMDTYTHSNGEVSISSSSAVNGIFSSRDALAESIMMSTACMSASVFSGMAGR